MLTFLSAQATVDKVFNLRTLQMGSDVMVAIKAQMRESHDAKKMIVEINQVEQAFKQQFPQTAWLFFEPDIDD